MCFLAVHRAFTVIFVNEDWSLVKCTVIHVGQPYPYTFPQRLLLEFANEYIQSFYMQLSLTLSKYFKNKFSLVLGSMACVDVF